MIFPEDLRRTFKLLPKGGRGRWLVLLLILMVNSLFEAVGVGIIFPFIKIATDPGLIEENAYLAAFVENTGIQDIDTVLVVLAAGVFTVFLGKNAMILYALRFSLNLIKDSEIALSTTMLGQYLAAPFTMYAQRNSAELIRNVDVSPLSVFGGIVLGYITLLAEILTLSAIAVTLVIVAPFVTLLALGGLFFGFGLFYKALAPKLVRLGHVKNDMAKASLMALRQAFLCAKELKILGRSDYFIDRYRGHVESRSNVIRDRKFYEALPRNILEIVLILGMLIVITILLISKQNTGDMMAVLAVFAVASLRLMGSFSKIVNGLNTIKFNRAALHDVYADFDTYTPPGHLSRHRGPGSAFKSLELRNVGYRYPEAKGWALQGISFSIRPGETIGLVGRSGSGKSTLADVVLGLLEPTEGALWINEQQMSTTSDQWPVRYGYVPQMISIIDDTIRRNIALGVEDDDIDDEAVWSALDKANLLDLIRDLPDGLDTVLGENGLRFSGGQRQRIGIARALYNSPEILVFDEATSALDVNTEKEVSLAMEQLAGERTMIIIAHRLSTVRNCDRLVRLEAGIVKETGSFDELMESSEDFRNVVKLGQLTDGDDQKNTTTATEA